MIDTDGSSSHLSGSSVVHNFGGEGGDHYDGGLKRMSILTQNVDGLHRKAETQHVMELRVRNDRERCM